MVEKITQPLTPLENTEKINEIIDNFADKNLSNLSTTGQEILDNKLNKQMITNCITEIPQDIKLVLSDGNITVKAGSYVYVPNGKNSDGSNKFDKVLITEDITIDASDGTATQNDWTLFINPNTKSGRNSRTIANFSGANAPTSISQYAVWYDTTNNVIKYTNNTGTSWTTNYTSFPVCIFTRTSGTASVINQIFNGFGYIGNTIFAFPGIKGLIPNGRNEDGTLRNSVLATTNVSTFTRSYPAATTNYCYFIYNNNTITDNIKLYIQDTIPSDWNLQVWVDTANNLIKFNNNGAIVTVTGCVFGNAITASGTISSFDPKNAYSAIDSNDAVKYSDFVTTKPTSTVSTASKTKPAVIVQNYHDGTNWCRIWSDGFIEQGGLRAGTLVNVNISFTHTFLKAFTQTPMVIVKVWSSQGTGYDFIRGITTSSFTFLGQSSGGNYQTNNKGVSWYACGY